MNDVTAEIAETARTRPGALSVLRLSGFASSDDDLVPGV
jgi:hypothetical protein